MQIHLPGHRGTLQSGQGRGFWQLAAIRHTPFAQELHYRAPIREAGLKQVEPDEGREQKPIRADEIAERETRHSQGARDHSQVPFNVHGFTLLCN
jgi:hypothetical protein